MNSVQDAAPNRQELDVETDQVDHEAEASAQQALKEEVSRTGLKIDKHRQMDLPTQTKAEAHPSIRPNGLFTLQVGSYPTVAEAKARLQELKPKGLTGWIKAAEVAGKGKHFRVYAGGFKTKAQAEEAGKSYVIKDWIDSFVVVPIPQN